MNDEDLKKELETYRHLSEQDKSIDVAGLMIQALQKQKTNLLSDKQKRWAYFISLVLPPLGFIFAIQFYFSDKDDGKQAAVICLVLTILALVLFWLFVKILFSVPGADFESFQEIRRDDIYYLIN